MKVLLLCSALAAACSLAAPIPPAHAADNSSGDNVQLTLSPTSVHVDLRPGAAKTGEFKVVNSGSRPFTAKVYAAPYRVTDEDYNPAFTGGGAQTQISRWIKFSQNEYVLEPNQVVTIRYTINVPAIFQRQGSMRRFSPKPRATKIAVVLSSLKNASV